MKKYLIWAVSAVALIAVIIGASTLYSKLSEEYKPAGGGIEELAPWGDGDWGAQPTYPKEEPVAPSEVESKPTEPSKNETEPSVSDPEPEVSTSTESESDEVPIDTSIPPQSEPDSPIGSSPNVNETPAPTEPETPAPTEPETPPAAFTCTSGKFSFDSANRQFRSNDCSSGCC